MVRPQEMIKSKKDFEVGFTRIVEHTVTSSASVIVTTLETLMRSGTLPADLFEMAHRAALTARDMASRVNAVSELFGSADSFSKLSPASYNVEQFMSVLIEQINLAIGDKLHGDITFHMEAEEERNAVFDARRISIIMYHLIGNSIKHGRTDNKNVRVTCRSEAGAIEICIRDFGGGLPARIYRDPFTYKGRLGASNLADGMPHKVTGLGLPLCYKLAKDMGGDLLAKNLKGGARFTLILPQEKRRLHEPKIFIPDAALMKKWMAAVFLEEENYDDNL